MLQKLLSLLLSSTGEGISKRASSLVVLVVGVGAFFGLGLNAEGLNELAIAVGPAFDGLRQITGGVVALVGFVRFLDGWIRAERYKTLGLGRYSKLGVK